jgi:hypothetical protein
MTLTQKNAHDNGSGTHPHSLSPISRQTLPRNTNSPAAIVVGDSEGERLT